MERRVGEREEKISPPARREASQRLQRAGPLQTPPRAPPRATREPASIINKSCGRERKRLSDAQALPELPGVGTERLPLVNVVFVRCRSVRGDG